MITEEKSLRITYNYSWLTRVLLKITYNNLRLKGENTVWIESFRDYILHGTNFPFHYRIKVGVEVVPCHRITEKERAVSPAKPRTGSINLLI